MVLHCTIVECAKDTVVPLDGDTQSGREGLFAEIFSFKGDQLSRRISEARNVEGIEQKLVLFGGISQV